MSSHDRLEGKCPACGWSGLFVGSGGYITCSQYDCPDPGAVADILRSSNPKTAMLVFGLLDGNRDRLRLYQQSPTFHAQINALALSMPMFVDSLAGVAEAEMTMLAEKVEEAMRGDDGDVHL